MTFPVVPVANRLSAGCAVDHVRRVQRADVLFIRGRLSAVSSMGHAHDVLFHLGLSSLQLSANGIVNDSRLARRPVQGDDFMLRFPDFVQ